MLVQRKAQATALDSTKKLSLGKRTLKDLSVRHAGPKGGYLTKVTIGQTPSTSVISSGTSVQSSVSARY